VSQTPSPQRVLLPLGLAVCLSLFGDLTLYVVLVTQREVVGLSLAAVGVMLGVNRLIRIPANPLAGSLLDRWGRRQLFVLGMLLGVLSTASYALVHSFWPFLASRLAWGLAWTLINVGGMAMVLDISTRSNRGELTGFYNTWLQAGFVLGPLTGGLLVSRFGFRPAMLACAGLAAIGLIVVVAALPETAAWANRAREVPPRPRLGLGRRLAQAWHEASRLLRADPRMATILALFAIVLFSGEGVILSTASLLLQQRLGQALALNGMLLEVTAASGILLGLRAVLASLSGPLAGHLSDARLGRWAVTAGSLLLGILGFGLLFFAHSLELAVLGILVGAISGGAALAVLAAYMGDLTPPGRQGLAMGAYATAGDAGSMVGPFLAFALAAWADLRWVYLLCTITFVIGLGLLWRIRAEVPPAR